MLGLEIAMCDAQTVWKRFAILAMEEAGLRRLVKVLDCAAKAVQVHLSLKTPQLARKAHSSHLRMRIDHPVAVVLDRAPTCVSSQLLYLDQKALRTTDFLASVRQNARSRIQLTSTTPTSPCLVPFKELLERPCSLRTAYR